MRRILTFLILSTMSTGLMSIGCCDCGYDGPAEIALRFSPDSLSGQGFRRAEVRSAYLIRYAGTLTNTIDTLRQRPGGLPPIGTLESLYISEGAGASLWLRRYTYANQPISSYRLVVPAASRQFDVTDIDIQAKASKGCGCVSVERLDFSLNGQRKDGRGRAAELVK
ncbi:hypothetical protein LJY25_14305 [Hymenobacter sp. BT175]|uniref:hypothetical protein n=1 Tax=Hymenobacter translucens TaxID=2886507 RepID=UPI001D0DF3F5|nr:hypothetical protein [Hymenobacter translucens]MCC2547624.1 hypothetical protein [Hymenobacter translucens]